MEGADVAQHPDSLVEGTVAIVGGEAVLLQKVVPDETSNVEGDLVTLSQCALSHQLDNLGQILLGLQNLLAFRPQGGEIAAAFQALVERLQRLQVLGVAEGPVDGGKVFPLRQFLVQAPENLDNPKSRRGDWIGKVSTRGTDCTNNTDTSFPPRISNTINSAYNRLECE